MKHTQRRVFLMKKFFYQLLAIITILFITYMLRINVVLAQSTNRSLTVTNNQGLPGSQVTIQIILNEGSGITALQLKLNFDSSILSVSDSSSITAGSLLTADHSLSANIQPGQISIVIFSASLASLKSGSGSIVNIKFIVNPNANPGQVSSLNLADVVLSDVNGNAVPTLTYNGIFTVLGNTLTTTSSISISSSVTSSIGTRTTTSSISTSSSIISSIRTGTITSSGENTKKTTIATTDTQTLITWNTKTVKEVTTVTETISTIIIKKSTTTTLVTITRTVTKISTVQHISTKNMTNIVETKQNDRSIETKETPSETSKIKEKEALITSLSLFFIVAIATVSLFIIFWRKRHI